MGGILPSPLCEAAEVIANEGMCGAGFQSQGLLS